MGRQPGPDHDEGRRAVDRQRYYSVLIPVAGIIYVIAMFLLDWNGTAVVVGALVLGAMAVLGQVFSPGT